MSTIYYWALNYAGILTEDVLEQKYEEIEERKKEQRIKEGIDQGLERIKEQERGYRLDLRKTERELQRREGNRNLLSERFREKCHSDGSVDRNKLRDLEREYRACMNLQNRWDKLNALHSICQRELDKYQSAKSALKLQNLSGGTGTNWRTDNQEITQAIRDLNLRIDEKIQDYNQKHQSEEDEHFLNLLNSGGESSLGLSKLGEYIAEELKIKHLLNSSEIERMIKVRLPDPPNKLGPTFSCDDDDRDISIDEELHRRLEALKK